MKKRNMVLPIIGALVIVIIGVAYIVMKITQQQMYEDKWSEYDECGI